MAIVIASGCPHSSWEGVVPMLQRAGLELETAAFNKWHDEYARLLDSPRKFALPERGLDSSVWPRATVADAKHLLLYDSRALSVLDFWAVQQPEACFLLFYVTAPTAVAHALNEGIDPERYLNEWQIANEQILRFQRRNRHRALLLDAEAAMRHPAAMIDACQRIDLSLRQAPSWPTSENLASNLEKLIGRAFIDSTAGVSGLQRELEASAYPLVDTESNNTAESNEGYLAYHELVKIKETLKSDLVEETEQHANTISELQRYVAANTDLEQENELLQLQLQQVLEELEHSFLKLQQLEQGYKQVEYKPVSDDTEKRDQARPGIFTSCVGLILRPLRRGKQRKKLQKAQSLVKVSGLFDEVWYLEHYPDVAMSGLDPIQHYLRFGAAERRNPSPHFDTNYYLQTYPDVTEAGLNPLLHYIKFGKAEGRDTIRPW